MLGETEGRPLPWVLGLVLPWGNPPTVSGAVGCLHLVEDALGLEAHEVSITLGLLEVLRRDVEEVGGRRVILEILASL